MTIHMLLQQAAAAEKAAKKDAGPSPEVLAEIQKKLEEAQILTAKNTAAAAEEAAKKEAEANQLAKKKGMQTLQVNAQDVHALSICRHSEVC